MSLECVEDSRHLFREPNEPPANSEPFSSDGTPNEATCHDVRSLHRLMEHRSTYPTTRQNISDKEKALIRELFHSRPDAAPQIGRRRPPTLRLATEQVRVVRARPDAAALPDAARRILLDAMERPTEFGPLTQQNMIENLQNIVRVRRLDILPTYTSLRNLLQVAFSSAYERNLLRVVQFLLNWRSPSQFVSGQFVDPRENDNRAVRRASEEGLREMVNLLLQWRGPNGEFVDPRTQDNEAVRFASVMGHTQTVDVLLQWRGPNEEFVDPRANDNEAVRRASEEEYNSAPTVNSLLQWRGSNGEFVDPRARNNEAIRRASGGAFRNTGTVDVLLQWRGPNNEFVDPRTRNNEAVRFASVVGRLEIVDRLLNWRGPNNEYVYPEDVAIQGAINRGHMQTAHRLQERARALAAQQQALVLT